MYLHTPSISILSIHGLTEVVFDSSGTTRQHPTRSSFSSTSTAITSDISYQESISGWAMLEPQTDYPLLMDVQPRKRQVRFSFCSKHDPSATLRFRKRAQFIALDTLSDQVPGGMTLRRNTERRRYSSVRQLLAWWEDEQGLWLITDEDHGAIASLSSRWPKMPWNDIDRNDFTEFDESFSGEVGSDITPVCARICQTLLHVVLCLQALEDRGLSLQICRPNAFCFQEDREPALLASYKHVSPQTGFSLPLGFAETAMGASLLFRRDSLETTPLELPESSIRQNLRYLAPEVVVLRRPSTQGDIFSFGVLAYEMLTGASIHGEAKSPGEEAVDLLTDIHRHITVNITSPVDLLREKIPRSIQSFERISQLILRCLDKDADERYSTLSSLAYDLDKLLRIYQVGGNLSKFIVGEVDNMSRFTLPSESVARETQQRSLSESLAFVERSRTTKVVNVWALSGCGKTRIVTHWSRQFEAENGLVGYAKLDEYSQKPLSSFVQVFQSLLDRVLTDPAEDPKVWSQTIRAALGTQFPFFLSLLSNEYRKLVSVGSPIRPAEAIDWENFMAAFRLWSKRLLLLFAKRERPLVLVVDDIQWMPKEELLIWRNMLDGAHPLAHTLVISLFRVEEETAPLHSSLLSSASDHLQLARLDEDGLSAFLQACFRPPIENADVLTGMLYAETAGSPLHLRTLLSSLVRESILRFDYSVLMWRFDPTELQEHLSDEGIDEYIGRLMRRLPEVVKSTLMVLSCLPSEGFTVRHLADLMGSSVTEIDSLLAAAQTAGGPLLLNSASVKFGHDRPRSVAYHLIPKGQLAILRLRISMFLRRSDLVEDYMFEAADGAIIARELGAPREDDEGLVTLLLSVTEKAALSATFTAARRYLQTAEDVITESGGREMWCDLHRQLYFRFLAVHAQICGVLKQHEQAFKKLYDVLPYCRTNAERVRIATLRIRQKISANRHADALNLTWATLREQGYDPDHLTTDNMIVPRTVAEVEDMVFTDDPVDVDDVRLLLLSLWVYAGPTVYVSRPNERLNFFALGLSLASAVGKLHESTAYVLVGVAITMSDVPIRAALCRLAMRLCRSRPTSYATALTLVTVAAQVHCWMPLVDVAAEMEPAFTASMTSGSYEGAGYVAFLDHCAELFSSRARPWATIAKRYEAMRPYLSAPSKMLLHTPMQYSENLAHYDSNAKPWLMEGTFIDLSDIEAVKGLALHLAAHRTFALRLAVLYNAPLDEQMVLVEAGLPLAAAMNGTVLGVEWSFLTAICAIRNLSNQSLVDQCYKDLQRHAMSPDFKLRICFLDALKALIKGGIESIDTSEEAIRVFSDQHQFFLAGLLNQYTADIVVRITGSAKLSSGFVRASFEAFHTVEAYGLCQRLQVTYPLYCSSYGKIPLHQQQLLSEVTGIATPILFPPALLRAPTSSSTATVSQESSTAMSAEDKSAVAGGEQALDVLTLMRSSLALASEQDSTVLLCTLLKILCQFTRADFAAIVLVDAKDNASLHLRAAGPSQHITPYDLDITDQASQAVAPAVILLHVARTGKAIANGTALIKIRSDPFYAAKNPRSIVCVPIFVQNAQQGVILLSSMTTTTSTAQSAGAVEVIKCLSTFAAITTTNHSFTRRLKLEADLRTRELSNALSAKTQFLSQCSHELRSPLSAVLGLTAVLEASPGLTPVQREYLRTIASSGEDLLGLINNILDHSRLESGSVSLEHIPFTMRDVVEGALETIAPAAQKKNLEITLINAIHSDPPDMMGDPFRIKQILLNLLSNAVKFTSEGRVLVHWRYESLADDKVLVTLSVESRTPVSEYLRKTPRGDCTASSQYGSGSTFTFSFVAEPREKQEEKSLPLKKDLSCFVISPLEPWWQMLEENLRALNCKPVRFTQSIEQCLVTDAPQGLNSNLDYDYVMINTQMLTKDTLNEMRRLQPKAKFIFLVRSVDLADAMVEFDIARESIVARPIKFKSLYAAFGPKVIPTIKVNPKSKANAELAKALPLDILLVDDNSVNLTVGKRILALFGYNDIVTASDGQQAIDAAERQQYDVILLDLQMPVLDGFTAQQRIKASPLAGDPCIVALTANADQATQAKCATAGFFDYLSKPLDFSRLERILSNAFDARKTMRSA